ncbi:glycosyltransferase [Lichenicola sp.]|uniref:glycosyltransferase n=1 Tax=Lichenicola sp. TaxID=2804529 RepID=UPI003B00B5CF
MAPQALVDQTQTGSRTLRVEGPLTSRDADAIPHQRLALHLLQNGGAGLADHASPGRTRHLAATADPGLSDADREQLTRQLAAAAVDAVPGVVYRFGWPYRAAAPGDRSRGLSFIATDTGLTAADFAPGSFGSSGFTQNGGLIVTPSHWSRTRLVESGYAPDAVHVVPFGVDPAVFHPITEAARQLGRAGLGCAPDEILFLHMGAASWANGADLLLRAFAALRVRGHRVRLLLADSSDPDGLAVHEMLLQLAPICPDLGRDITRAAITILSGAHAPSLYGVADCLVAPVRATSFALPVLEAIACGTPIIVPRGGAADDLFADAADGVHLGWRISAEPASDGDVGVGVGAGRRWIEPQLEALIAAMAEVGCRTGPDPALSVAARDRVLHLFGWARAAYALRTLSAGMVGPETPDIRIRLNSFDVFDTLIARRCLEPWRIFEQVGAQVGIPGFVQARLMAEGQLAGRAYTLDDIYVSLAGLWSLTPDQADWLKSLELAAEIDNVIPIAENIDQVRHGDLLISDMYLPEPAIRSLLAAAGLDKRVGLIVSTRGKREGLIWPRIAPTVDIARHLGDDVLADVEMPTRFGIPSVRTEVATPSLVEGWLMQAELRPLALLVREARLRSTHEDPVMRGLQRIQVDLNLPILLLSTIQLLRVAGEIGADRLLFCSRDCDLWLELFRALRPPGGGPAIPAEYFYTSRIARLGASPDYLAYARDRIGARGLLVDACGTGWSASHLLQSLGRLDAHAFFIHQCAPLAVYEQSAPTPRGCTIHAVIHPESAIPNVGIEMVNTAEHGSVSDVRTIAGAVVPVLGQGYADPAVRRAIGLQRRAFMAALSVLTRHDLGALFELSPERIASVVQPLYEHLHAQPELRSVFLAEFRRETREVHATLNVPLA